MTERSKSFAKQKKRRNRVKEFIIITVILILIFGGALYTNKYLDRTANDLLSELKDLKQNIMKMNEEDSGETIKKETKNLIDKWNQTEDGWAIIILHDELDFIETSLTKMQSSIENDEFKDSLEELDNAIFLVEHIKQKEKFSLKNIF